MFVLRTGYSESFLGDGLIIWTAFEHELIKGELSL